jgi:predicted glycogen debranching enzyme
MEDGLIPNYFPDEGQEAEYNSVDGSLWFVNALGSHWRASGDHDLVEELWPRVEEVVASYQGGTKFGIGLDDQGFVVLPRGPLALTWMDARVGGEPVTPRHGRPVEVQALWFNALRWAETMASHLGKRSPVEIDLAAFPREFKRAFWRPDLGYLLDTHSPDDPALRPNQLLALALPHPVFGSPAEAARVIAAVDSDLLTPLGLRTLSPRHPSYRGTYGGPPHERDEAYHNGTVWPWLLGPYGDVLARWGSRPPGWLDYLLGGLLEHAFGRGLGNLPELFSGDPPHRPGGCVAQAWSVAEVLRLRWRYGTGGNRARGHGGAW